LVFSLDKLVTRKILTQKECPKLTTLYILVFTAPLCLILILITNSWVCPNYYNLFMLLLLGILGCVANFAFTKSLATAEITSIMPYGITKLIFSAILSYIFFDEILETFNVWLGVIIISISTILLL
jgi:drug/metabolite transporter (DMT)-like permease